MPMPPMPPLAVLAMTLGLLTALLLVRWQPLLQRGH